MAKPPPGSLRDTARLAARYSETSHWQHERGLDLVEAAAPKDGETVVDLGCGTGELSLELARRVAPTGRLIGVDPDPARLKQAKESIPAGIANIVFEQASAEALDGFDDASVDVVYSNYAVHWVLDQPAMLDEVRRVLRPGGRFVAEFLHAPPQLLVDLILSMPKGESLMEENCFLSEAEWQGMIAARPLEAVRFEHLEVSVEYKSLGSLFDWLEGTSQGAFDAQQLPPKSRAEFQRRFPGQVPCINQSFRIDLRRTG